MIEKFRQRISTFLNNSKDYPFLVGIVAGVYPLLFSYSNNYPSIDSIQHLLFFGFVYVVAPTMFTLIAYQVFKAVPKLNPYKTHLLFVLFIMITGSLLSMAIALTLMKKRLLCLLVVACLASFKIRNYYKHLILIVCAMAILPFFKTAFNFYEDMRGVGWTQQPDDIVHASFKHRPNIYMIQPDGYAGREAMEKPPYSYQNNFYAWLEKEKFTIYPNFKSNYPASLASNASMFGMKQHYFNDVFFPSIEMPNARTVVMDNPAVQTFKNNGYETFFIAEDEYFQQNLCKNIYDHYNIDESEIPFFTYGGNVKREVYDGLTNAISVKTSKPKFIFVEKVLPHHIHFEAPEEHRIAIERKGYLEKIEEANAWLKKTIAMINAKDSNALIIILSDHGGWVGLQSMDDLFSNKDPKLINSTFKNFAAIQWNGVDHEDYDKNLKSQVNVFRVLFSCLSENRQYLKNLQDDSSYNIVIDNMFYRSVYKMIDANDNVVRQKHE